MTERDVTDLLTPDDVREMERKALWPYKDLARLCRDYLTLWEKNEKKRAALKDRGVIETVLEICEEERDALKVRVTQLEQEIGALMR